MRADTVNLRLRPRGVWEAMDLGVAMARQWWRPVWAAWLAVYLPAALILALVFRNQAWLGGLVLWWLKPAFDRVVLYVMGRAVFGQAPRLREVLGGWREIVSPGLLASLTLRRFDPARSFGMPVWQLERQSGVAAVMRRRTLHKRLWTHAVWLTVICVHIEGSLLLAAGSVADLFVPAKSEFDFETGDGDTGFSMSTLLSSWSWTDTVAYALAVSVVEPLYVSAGFALYLDRRMRLEGWDVEVALRGLAQRLVQPVARSMMAIGLAAAIVLGAAPEEVHAAGTPKEEAARILESPEFRTHREQTTWRYRGATNEDEKEEADPAFWIRVAKFLAQAGQFLGWVTLVGLVVAGLWAARRLIPAFEHSRASAPESHGAVVQGRLCTGESLPGDVARAAAALAGEGRLREALSLLYRGAVAVLAARYGLSVAAGDTGAEVVQRAVALGTDSGVFRFTADLVRTWERAAYSAQGSDIAQVSALCAAWDTHFGASAAGAGA